MFFIIRKFYSNVASVEQIFNWWKEISKIKDSILLIIIMLWLIYSIAVILNIWNVLKWKFKFAFVAVSAKR